MGIESTKRAVGIEKLDPKMTIRVVERLLSSSDQNETRRWLVANWDSRFLEADVEVMRMLVPYLEISQVKDRAALVLYAVDHDWVDVLSRAGEPACGFLAPFWRNAFARAQQAGSSKCIAWLLDNKAEILGVTESQGLEL
ncbi:MAG: hypothetical protein Q4C36_07605 [Coriobacteriia bacterium]|nr:hypothetical protein [Coriobacteriia bacterium]